jgi:hypothetical protein
VPGTERDNYPPSTGDACQRIDSALQCIGRAHGALLDTLGQPPNQVRIVEARSALQSAREHLLFGRELFLLQAKGVQLIEQLGREMVAIQSRAGDELRRSRELIERLLERDHGDTTVGGDG